MLSTWQGRDWRLVAEAPISICCRFGALGDRTPICRRFNALGDGAPVLASDDEEPLDRTEVILGVFNFGRPPSRFARVSRGAVDGECDPPAAVPPQALASGLDNDDACLPLDRRFLGVFGRPLASRSARVRHGAMDGEGARASPSTRPPSPANWSGNFEGMFENSRGCLSTDNKNYRRSFNASATRGLGLQ